MKSENHQILLTCARREVNNPNWEKLMPDGRDESSYSSNKIRKTQNEHLNIVCQKFEQSIIVTLMPIF